MQALGTKPILVVDDDVQMRSALTEAIQRLGYSTVVCRDGDDAVSKLGQETYSLVVTDMKMPKLDGLGFLKEARRRNSSIPVLVITGFGTVENAVESMKEGAIDYLMKPFSFDALKRAVDSVMTRTAAEKTILAENSEMRRIVSLARDLAGSEITVLIQGESGTGKEVLAQYIHRTSSRGGKPFIAVNCAAIPDTLLESELFGHEKGSFTGALEKKHGKFEQANESTILLDEIGEMPMTLQAKLLRVLQERVVDRVGGREPVSVDVRVIATTNRDLSRECREGRFREDLYYRLNVFPLKVPPLRERREDIPLLADHFRVKYSLLSKKDVEGITPRAADLLRDRPWRGNIRELENTIQRAVFICPDRFIDTTHLLFDEPSQQAAGRIIDMEKDLILRTLKEVDGNKTRAAKMLGISVRTIRNKLNEYGQNFPAA